MARGGGEQTEEGGSQGRIYWFFYLFRIYVLKKLIKEIYVLFMTIIATD